MSIVTPSASSFPIPPNCPCGGKFHKHGKRRRHVIEREKAWYLVQRLRCSACGRTFTLLLSNMLPYKHYAAPEIEQVIQSQEDPTVLHECEAEESTLYRWKLEFPPKLNALASFFESLTNVFKIHLVSPLQRLYDALASLAHPPPNHDRLAWAFFMSRSHPVHIG